MTSSKLTLTPVPALKDNYIWCLSHTETHCALIVDPGEAQPIEAYLLAQKLTLDAILITHHHPDHTAGISKLKKRYPDARVIGPAKENIPHCTDSVAEGSNLIFPNLGLTFQVLDIPGHTLGHVAYFNDTWLFCGDTLFSCGCGRVFEGTPKMMYHSLEKIRFLNDSLLMCCGHEYTQANLKFASTVLPHSVELHAFQESVKKRRLAGETSLPTPLGLEKNLNPFLGCHHPDIIKSVQIHAKNSNIQAPEDIFAHLRSWKDTFS
jgi:hydroxyacylglutathione hydrolase